MQHKILIYIVWAFFIWFNVSGIVAIAQDAARELVLKDSVTNKKPESRYFSIGLSAGSYKGDLSHRYRRYMPGMHIGLQFERKKRLNGLVSLFFGSVAGDNPLYSVQEFPEAKPNLSFSTRIIAFQYELQLNLVSKRYFRIFVSQGLGLINYTPQDESKQSLFEQQLSRPAGETYSAIAASLPTGLGIRAKMPNNIRFILTAQWQNPQTDYLDNISQWGNKKGRDNIFMGRLLCQIPL